MSVLNLARAIVAELDGQVSHGTVLSSVPWDSGRRPERWLIGQMGQMGHMGQTGCLGQI